MQNMRGFDCEWQRDQGGGLGVFRLVSSCQNTGAGDVVSGGGVGGLG